jgi:hypothetical protein
MPFDGLQVSRRGAVSVRPGAAGKLRDRWQALTLWLRFGERASGVEALERTAPSELADSGTVQVLMAAAALIEPPHKWIRGAYRTFGGRYCAMGALQAAGLAYDHATRIRARRLLVSVARARGFPTVERLNDTSTHGEVLAAFDAAITLAIAERMAAYPMAAD